MKIVEHTVNFKQLYKEYTYTHLSNHLSISACQSNCRHFDSFSDFAFSTFVLSHKYCSCTIKSIVDGAFHRRVLNYCVRIFFEAWLSFFYYMPMKALSDNNQNSYPFFKWLLNDLCYIMKELLWSHHITGKDDGTMIAVQRRKALRWLQLEYEIWFLETLKGRNKPSSSESIQSCRYQ